MHTKITLRGILMLKDELQETKKSLTETQQSLTTTQQSLTTTQHELATTKILLDNHNALIEAITKDPNIYPVTLCMKEIVQPDVLQTNFFSYESKIKHIFGKIEKGNIYKINENEYFFKLSGFEDDNYNHLRIRFRNSINGSGHKTIYRNDWIKLDDDANQYSLFMAIEDCAEDNTKCFLIHTTHSGSNYEIENGVNYDINWEEYCNGEDDEVLFYLKKDFSPLV